MWQSENNLLKLVLFLHHVGWVASTRLRSVTGLVANAFTYGAISLAPQTASFVRVLGI